jgi:hypothetical protein
VLHVRIKRVHRRKSVLSAKTVNTDKRYFRVHRVDHLDCCGAYDRMLNLANDSAEDAAAYVAMWLASRPIVTEMQIHGRQHAARLSMAKDQGLLAVNPHIPTIVEVLTNAEIFFPVRKVLQSASCLMYESHRRWRAR